MKVFRSASFGIITAAFTTLLVLGAFSLAFSEGGGFQSIPVSPTAAMPVVEITFPPNPALTEQPTEIAVVVTSQLTPLPPELPTATQLAPTTCPPPAGWVSYQVQAGDTIQALADSRNISSTKLKQGNCLVTNKLMPGTILYLPQIKASDTPQAPTVQPSKTPVPCGPPYGWVKYTIQPGDTLFRLSLSYGVSVPELQQANCLGSSTLIRVGDILYVPYLLPRTATPTRTATKTPSPQPTATKTQPASYGAIQIQKVVDWNSVPADTSVSFKICISGPTYPSGKCKTVGWQGGTLTWTTLNAGTYQISEIDPGSNWNVTNANPTLVVSGNGDTVYGSITNRRLIPPSSLVVQKSVDWQGITPNTNQTFEICITGPSHPSASCQTVGYAGGNLTWGNLTAGTYTVIETNPGEEWIVSPGSTSVSLAVGQNQTVSMSNTRKLGGISLTYTVDWKGAAPDPALTFSVCAAGPSYASPSCQNTSADSGTMTWSSVIPGSYALTVANAGPDWQVIFSGSPAVVPTNGGTATATLTLEHN